MEGAGVSKHVSSGGCFGEFCTAMTWCHPDYTRDVHAEEYASATAALRRCFAGNTEMFRDQYLRRIDEGLDQDLKPSPEQVEKPRTGSGGGPA